MNDGSLAPGGPLPLPADALWIQRPKASAEQDVWVDDATRRRCASPFGLGVKQQRFAGTCCSGSASAAHRTVVGGRTRHTDEGNGAPG